MRRKALLFYLLFVFLAVNVPAFAHEGHEDEVVTVAEKVSLLGFDGVRGMINPHPLFVHLPMALFLASTLFYLLGALTKKNSLLEAGRWTLFLGTLSAVPAVWSGLGAEDTVEHGAQVHRIIELHENIAFALLGSGALLSVWLIAVKKTLPEKGRGIFLAALVLLAVLTLQQADLGGRMVYLHGTGVRQESRQS